MIKKLLLSCFILLTFTWSLTAQKFELPAVYQTKAELIAAYDFSEKQQVTLDKILTTRNRNLAAIASLQANDEPTYWNKRKAIYLGQRNSIERLLGNDQQRAVFSERKKNDRIAESEIIKRLLAEGHSRDEARFLLLTERY